VGPRLSGVSGATIQSHHSRVRDVGRLGVWLTRPPRPCPRHACSPARPPGLSRWHRVGEDTSALPEVTSFARIAIRPSAAPSYVDLCIRHDAFSDLEI
jgi:hypothetical protein